MISISTINSDVMDALIESAIVFNKNLGINADTDLQKFCRRAIASKKVDLKRNSEITITLK